LSFVALFVRQKQIQNMQNNKILVWVLIALVAGLVGGYWYGQSKGYSQAQADIKKVQEQGAKKAGEDAAKAANPFQAVNPLQGVNANPFEKAKKILNPFK